MPALTTARARIVDLTALHDGLSRLAESLAELRGELGALDGRADRLTPAEQRQRQRGSRMLAELEQDERRLNGLYRLCAVVQLTGAAPVFPVATAANENRPGDRELASSEARGVAQKNLGGRSERFPWRELYLEALRIAHFEEGGIQSLDHLREKLRERMVTWSEQPAERTFRTELARIAAHLILV
jgi:hypothetical protein